MTVAILAIMTVAGSFALTALTMLAAIGLHNAFEWWLSESARGLKSLPRTFIRWIEGRNWPFRRMMGEAQRLDEADQKKPGRVINLTEQ